MNQDEITNKETSKQTTIGFFSRITGVLFSPSKTFAYLDKRPDVWGAMILIIIVAFCTMFIYAQKSDFKTISRTRLELSPRYEQLSEEQIERVVNIQSKVEKYMSYVGPFLTPIIYLIIAGALYLIFKLFQGETTFRKTFSVVTYSFLPTVFSSLIAFVLLLAGKVNTIPIENLVKSSIMSFWDQKLIPPFWWRLGTSFDIFSIWTIILVSIGMAKIKKIKFIYSFLVVYGIWLIYVFGASALAALGR